MKILLTGSNGFLGNKIYKTIKERSDVIGLARSRCDIICNLANQVPCLASFDMTIHCAGKAHSVPTRKKEKQDFFDVNVIGTLNLLKGLEQTPARPKYFVFISSVAVYGLEKGINIDEEHPLNAKDPYGLSKIQAEKIVIEWCAKNNVICTILRLPLLIGKNPPGNLRVMINGIKKGYYMNIAGGFARKSMVMVEDVAKFIIPVSSIGGIYNLTDGYHPSFQELSICIAKKLDKKIPRNIPSWMASFLAKTGDLIGKKSPFNTYKLSKITSDLTFDDSKARNAVGWDPNNVLKAFTL